MVDTRWQPPRLYTPHAGQERRVSWVELLYDLLYVAIFIQLGLVLSADISWMGLLGFLALFVPVWRTWASVVFSSNRFGVDDVWHRLLLFVQMFAIVAVAMSIDRALVPAGAAQFAIAYAVLRTVLIGMYWRAGRHIEEARPLASSYAKGFGVAVLVWLVSAFVPAPWHYILWAIAIGIEIGVPLIPRLMKLRALLPPDVPHMIERYSLFTLLVLGEALVAVITRMAGADIGPIALLYGLLSLIIAGSLLWLYFEGIVGATLSQAGMSPAIWVSAHLPLAAGLTMFGMGVNVLLLLPAGALLKDEMRLLVLGAVALTLVAMTVADVVIAQGYSRLVSVVRVGLRAAAAAALVLLFFLGGTLGTAVLLGIAAGVCVLPVLVDLILLRMGKQPAAPDEQSAEPAPAATDQRDIDIIPEGAKPQAPYIEYIDPPDDRTSDG